MEMLIWRIEIGAARKPSDVLRNFSYTGTATTAEIALRKMHRKAKKDGLWKIEVRCVEYLGYKEF